MMNHYGEVHGLKKRQIELRQDLGELQRYRNTGLSPEEVERLVAPMVCIIGELDEEGCKKIEASRVVHLKPADPLEAFYTGWVDVRNAVPLAGIPVLIVRRKNMSEPLRVEQGVRLPTGCWKTFGHKFQPENVLYWMPLPEPPEEVQRDV